MESASQTGHYHSSSENKKSGITKKKKPSANTIKINLHITVVK